MKIFDISRGLTNDLAPWPGDTPFTFELKGQIAQGSSVNVGAIEMSVHNGTHADAEFHFDSAGWTMEKAELQTYFGPAVVLDLTKLFQDGTLPKIGVGDLERMEALSEAPRLLLKTGIWPDSTKFPKKIPVIAPEVPAWLQARGVKLLGLDLPSVDEIDAKELLNHHSLGKAGINIVESLDLSEIREGRYQFVGLPLKIAGADGAPIRAILWRD
ncbi:MAG: cyclase family protein [Verrucomicrobiota bacterium]|nr:cyclase family protein [Verrucomicrobiota bacterium]